MQKRRERIEKWRADKKKKEMESAEAGQDESQPKEAKKWSLEEEESDEDENGANGAEDGAEAETELDPLDAYMTEVSKEVRKIKGGINVKNSKVFNKNAKNEGTILHYITALLFIYIFTLIFKGNGDTTTKKKGLVIMTGVAKKKPEVRTKKPDVMEQNQDALEYSSEDEVDINDLKDNLKEKGKKDLVKIDHATIDYEDFR